MQATLRNTGKRPQDINAKFFKRNDAIDHIPHDDDRFCKTIEESLKSFDRMIQIKQKLTGPFPYGRL